MPRFVLGSTIGESVNERIDIPLEIFSIGGSFTSAISCRMNNKPTPPFYVERRLFRIDEKGETQFITDAQLFNRPRPLVVLGEPGMGKTKLLERISSNFENALLISAEN